MKTNGQIIGGQKDAPALKHDIDCDSANITQRGACEAHLLEGQENLVKFVLGDADPVIVDGDLEHVVGGEAGLHPDLARVGEFAGVANEVVEDLDDAPRVPKHIRKVGRDRVHQADIALGLRRRGRAENTV